MRYSITETIGRPRSEVAALFEDPANLPHWQEAFVSLEPLSGPPGAAGSKTRLTYRMGRREIVMEETIEENALPERFTAVYEAPGVWNRCANHFSEPAPGRTDWRMENEFRCRGFMRLMTLFLPGMFRRQTAKSMADFRRFAESR